MSNCLVDLKGTKKEKKNKAKKKKAKIYLWVHIDEIGDNLNSSNLRSTGHQFFFFRDNAFAFELRKNSFHTPNGPLSVTHYFMVSLELLTSYNNNNYVYNLFHCEFI